MKVRDLLRLIEGDGWYLVRTRGSHPQAGRAEAMKRYLVIVEHTGTGFSAYSPDLPGCIATGGTRDEVEANMRGAIEFHIEGLRLEGYAVPEPTSESTYIDVAA